jgi:phthalate 4,5-cis-dihydrodiol dehydrogenase
MSPRTDPQKPLRLGVVGMGRAFTVMIPTFIRDPRIQLVAGADPREEARQQFEQDFGGSAYKNCKLLLDHSDIDIVYLATPANLHVEQIKEIVAAGKHVLLEKPMALSIEEAQQIIKIVIEAGVYLIVGHSHGFNLPIQQARELIISGTYGPLQMLTAFNFTDFMYRPRRRDELITEKGGGVVFSQAAHQIDILRILGGGCVKSIRANTGNWDPNRDTEGAYNALLTFENGTTATATYSGYAHFDSDELMGWNSELGSTKNPDVYWQSRKILAEKLTETTEENLKSSQNFGGKNYNPKSIDQEENHHYQHFGTVIASCEKADIRPMPWGVTIYSNNEHFEDRLSTPSVPRSEVIDELINAICFNVPPTHDGNWALANLEVSLAILESAKNSEEINLKYQIPNAVNRP